MHDSPPVAREVFDALFRKGLLPVRRTRPLDTPLPPMPAGFDFGRAEGMMLGLAIGDSLGNFAESLRPAERRERFGEIRDFAPDRKSGEPLGLPSDDTQLAFWTLEQAVEDGGFDPERLAKLFARRKIFGIGATVRDFVENVKEKKLEWHRAGTRSAGNGALMRIAPVVIPHLRSGGTAPLVEAALDAFMTHPDPFAIASAVAFTGIFWRLLAMDAPPPRDWWLDAYLSIARDLEGDEESYTPRAGQFIDYAGSSWDYVRERVEGAFAEEQPTLAACESWGSGAYLLETVPSVLYILARHAHDPEEAIVRAANDTFDSDTCAAIVGAAVGALHGRRALPGRWLEGLPGRTGERDDGRIFGLLRMAREKFWDR